MTLQCVQLKRLKADGCALCPRAEKDGVVDPTNEMHTYLYLVIGGEGGLSDEEPLLTIGATQRTYLGSSPLHSQPEPFGGQPTTANVDGLIV